jgi:hypothetical protein
MKVSLRLQKAKKRNDTETMATLYARVRDSKTSFDCWMATKMKVNPNIWDNTKSKVKDRIVMDNEERANINHEASSLISYLETEYANAEEPITKDWVEMTLDKYYFPDKYNLPLDDNRDVISMYDYYLEMHQLSEVRKKNNEVVKRVMQRYELFINKTKRNKNKFKLKLEDVTCDTLHDMWIFFKNEYLYVEQFPDIYDAVPEKRKPKPRGENTLIDYFCKMRTFFIWCYDNDFTRNRPFDKFPIAEPVYGSPVYITLEERDKLMKTDFSDDPKLGVQRDIFVFQSLVGCRIGDLYAMTKKNVINGVVEYIAGKTVDGDPRTIRVPLNSLGKDILARYQDYDGETLFPFSLQQDYNEDIKKSFMKAGLDRIVTILNPTTRKQEQKPLYEVATSHMARRAFVGNLYKKVKDKSLVAVLSGHKSDSKAFDRYWTPDDDIRQSMVDLLDMS